MKYKINDLQCTIFSSKRLIESRKLPLRYLFVREFANSFYQVGWFEAATILFVQTASRHNRGTHLSIQTLFDDNLHLRLVQLNRIDKSTFFSYTTKQQSTDFVNKNAVKPNFKKSN